MHEVNLASRTFDDNDQAVFARLSADFNPMHMDPVAARRTQAGAPVVHGVHAALWGLDKIAEAGLIKDRVVSLNVHFNKFIYVGGKVSVTLLQTDDTSIKAELTLDGLTTTTLLLGLGTCTTSAGATFSFDSLPTIHANHYAKILSAEEMANLSGRMDFAAPAHEVTHLFPHATSTIGYRRVAAITTLSRLVGMICPGLHSLFSSFALELVNDKEDGVGFAVTKVHDKRRIVRMNVHGAGICGSVLAFVRVPPVAQASISNIRQLVSPGEFADSTSLIIGGSRGLGELTAKTIAAAGGEVIVTYAKGREDAMRLAQEINREMGASVCHLLQLDVRKNIAKQLSSVTREITHLYYFATPNIFRQKEKYFSKALFDEFAEIYVKGFYDCWHFFASRGLGRFIVYYPSSVAVEEHPLAMTEYSMAKAAGEMLCADINRSERGVHVVVNRLPRMLTDQTATVMPVKNANPLDVMLPIIRNVQLQRTTSDPFDV